MLDGRNAVKRGRWLPGGPSAVPGFCVAAYADHKPLGQGAVCMGNGKLDAERGFLNKWEMYKALAGESIGPCRLPDTVLYREAALASMLMKYGKVYIKTVSGWGGHAVSVLEARRGVYRWLRQGQTALRSRNLRLLAKLISAYYHNQICIIQQAAPLARFQDRPFDIRVHMQRDVSDEWIYAGELVRLGGTHAIVSNVDISRGKVLPMDTVLPSLHLRYGPEQIRWRLQKVGASIANVLNPYRDFRDIGIDIGISHQGQLWLIEVNTDDAQGAPSYELFAKLPDKQIYEQIKQRDAERNAQIVQSILQELFGSEGLGSTDDFQ